MGCNCSKSKTPAAKLAESVKPPSYNLTNVVADTIFGTAEMSSSDKREKRLEICKKCPNIVKLPLGINGTGNCSKCGCFVDMKVKYEKSRCPVFKW